MSGAADAAAAAAADVAGHDEHANCRRDDDN